MAEQDTIERLLAEQEALEDKQASKVVIGLKDVPVLIIFWILFATVLAQFFTRYVLNDSLSWTEELARYLLVLLVLLVLLGFVGAIRCQITDSHIRLEFIDKYLGRYTGAVKLFALVLTTGFFMVSAWSLWVLIERTTYQKMVSLPFPKYYFYSLVMVALLLIIVVPLRQIYARIFKGKK